MNTPAKNILEYNDWLSNINIDLPHPYKLTNHFANNPTTKQISINFYNKYYNDTKKRYLILGSSPARRGTSITGIPFEEADYLYQELNIKLDNFHINKSSSNFLYEVIEKYGGRDLFYKDFYLNFICPLGIVKTNNLGHETNANYYDTKLLEKTLSNFIIDSLKKQISPYIDTSVCFCIGSGENFKFLTKINNEYKFFKKIIPLEHPRFIMQYNSRNKEEYLTKYLNALINK